MTRFTTDKETICATITASGRSGIAVVRLSGDNSESIIRKFCDFLPTQLESHRVYYGYFREALEPLAVDEVLVTYFQRGRSFTGEATFEISCHGNQVIASELLTLLCKGGARLATRGEFTYRAFINGRIDLVQAESVLELIQSRSKRAAQLATRQLQGDFSKKLRELLQPLTWILANLEADIDFSAEDIVIAGSEKLAAKAEDLLSAVRELLIQMRHGRILKNGYQVALMGRVNAGKSSLLNALLGEERAIVTEIAGTTRDFVHGEMTVDGFVVDLIDTAGLRESSDRVETIGVDRAFAKAGEVDRIFYLIDGELGKRPEDQQNLSRLPKEQVTLVWNKSDLVAPEEGQAIGVSAKSGQGLDELRQHLRQLIADEFSEDAPALSNARHFEGLELLKTSLESAVELLKESESPDLIALELQSGLQALHELLGIVYDDQVMDRVFQEFCIGK